MTSLADGTCSKSSANRCLNSELNCPKDVRRHADRPMSFGHDPNLSLHKTTFVDVIQQRLLANQNSRSTCCIGTLAVDVSNTDDPKTSSTNWCMGEFASTVPSDVLRCGELGLYLVELPTARRLCNYVTLSTLYCLLYTDRTLIILSRSQNVTR